MGRYTVLTMTEEKGDRISVNKNNPWYQNYDSAEAFENLYRLIYRYENDPYYADYLNTVLEEVNKVRKLIEIKLKR